MRAIGLSSTDAILPHTDARVSSTAVGSTRDRQYSGIDQLRAVSVLAVMVHHFHPFTAVNLGTIGVQLFFVISGFLITGILVDSRATRLRAYLATFYIRRALRIFPVYYLVLLLAFAAGEPSVRANLLAHLTYTNNFAVFVQADWIGPSTHFWSLAVEEQFYLVWPWVVFAVPPRALPGCLLLLAAASPLCRLLMSDAGYAHPQIYVLTPTNLDSLAGGGLLALFVRMPIASRQRRRVAATAMGIGLGIALACQLLGRAAQEAGFELGVALAGCGLVLAAIHLRDERASAAWTLLGRAGAMSYGLYLIHPFVFVGLSVALRHAGIGNSPAVAAAKFAAYFALCFLLAACSYRYFERPILRLKRRLVYGAGREPAPIPRAPAGRDAMPAAGGRPLPQAASTDAAA